jgi:hypothetical protein
MTITWPLVLLLAFVLPPLPPPIEFDQPFPGVVIEHMLPARQAQEICGGGRRLACMLHRHGSVCHIVLPRVEEGLVTVQQQALIRRHEIGHCNGWPADHRS